MTLNSLRLISIASLILWLSGCTAMGTATLPYDQLAKKYTNSESQYIEVNGLTIHYRDEGSGPPLLLLHGVASSLHTWDAWTNQLKNKYRVIRIDMPGFGLTGPDSVSDAQTPEYMNRVINGLVDQLGIQRFFLVGSSLGGYFAWNYAAAYPERLYKMALLSPVGYPQDMPFWLGFASFPGLHWITPTMMPRFLVHWTAESAYADEDKLDESVKQRYFDFTQRRGNRESYVQHFLQFRELAHGEDKPQKVKDVLTPTLLMWGAQDDWIPLDVMREFYRDLSYSDYIVYEGVGHLPMEELPLQTARDVDHFFMDELRKVDNHPQETAIKYYDKDLISTQASSN
ncbi:alpha/beta hydrolase [Bermanella marisrubri]|nr:alpha/beta hydrolase [Bermanella marisrubri]QIZ84808.1 alpha/beta hydrolase [Bermanella marisrubri]